MHNEVPSHICSKMNVIEKLFHSSYISFECYVSLPTLSNVTYLVHATMESMSDSMALDREIDESEIFSLERRLMFSQEMIISKKKKISQARMDLERMQGGYQEVSRNHWPSYRKCRFYKMCLYLGLRNLSRSGCFI